MIMLIEGLCLAKSERGRRKYDVMDKSAAVCWDCVLDLLAFDAFKINILAVVAEEAGDAHSHYCCEQQAAAPGNRHLAHHPLGCVGGVGAAEPARSPIIVVVVDMDDSGSSAHVLHLHGWGHEASSAVVGRGYSISGLLSVHFTLLSNL